MNENIETPNLRFFFARKYSHMSFVNYDVIYHMIVFEISLHFDKIVVFSFLILLMKKNILQNKSSNSKQNETMLKHLKKTSEGINLTKI